MLERVVEAKGSLCFIHAKKLAGHIKLRTGGIKRPELIAHLRKVWENRLTIGDFIVSDKHHI